MIETYRGVVRPHQLDHMGHMNVQWYTAVFDEATWHLFSLLGLTNSYFKSEMRGMAAVEQHTKYLAEVMAGDLLVCRSRLTGLENKVLKFEHHMFNAETETLAATTSLVGAHLDREIRKACPFPGFVAEKFAELAD
ncbi:MAG: acyl-CoA thioesterase [Nitratireductor sp.]|nr:acyl-CoA thioesterase [Nitratireductor sp.]